MNSIVISAAITRKVLFCFFIGALQISDTFAALEKRELVYVDPLVKDYQQLVSTLPDTTQIVVLDPKKNGFAQIAEHLAMQRNVNTIHLISHGQEGKVQAGNLWLSADNIADNKTNLSSIGSVLGASGEILLYGCQVAKNNKGREFVGLLAAATGANVAASDDWTGDAKQGGNWQLETVIGTVQANTLPINKSYPHLLNTINAGDMVVLGWNSFNDTVTFATLVDLPAGTEIKITDWGWNAAGNAFTGGTTADGLITWTTSSSINAGTILNLFLGGTGDAQTTTLTNITTATDLTADITITGYTTTDPMGVAGDGIFIYQDADSNPYFIFGINNSSGTNLDANNWNTSVSFITLRDSTLPGGTGSQNALTNGTNAVGLPGGASQQDNVQYTGPTTSADRATWLNRVANLSNWTGDMTGATATSVGTSGGSFMAISSPPVVTDGNISISGATGTGGAYRIGDTVTATWNNTAGGDNNAGITAVTVDFSQFGGGAAVAATNSANTWTASYTITAGAIDATNRNVSVTATSANGPTTTADTSNATVDNQAPTVTNANISISGGTGTGGAYIIGDTATVTWNNSGGGDGNTDTINSVTVDFSQFGGNAAVVATNDSGLWTATYTITAGAIDATNRNVSVTATDNAGNTTTTADTTNATVDNVAPTVTDANVSISGGTGSGGTYIIGNTVTATWNNTVGGDNNSDAITNVTFDFSQFGGGAAVAATNSANTWTATYTVVAGVIEAGGRNVSVTAMDNAGNVTTRADTSNAAVDNAAPTVASVSVPANATYIAGQNLDFTVNIAAGSDVVVNTTGGTPRIALTIGAATRYASYVSGSASPWLTFRYTVQSGDLDANGIAVAGMIDADGGTLRDGSGNSMNLTLNSVGSTAAVLVDAVAPTVSSVTVPTDDTYTTGETLSFTINTTENVTVNTGAGTPYLPLTIGATAREAEFVSGSGTTALVFAYTVQAGDNDSDGIALGAAVVLGGGTMRDAAGNNLTLTLNNVGAVAGILVDAVAPTLQSLSPADGSTTVAADASFVMTFSESIALGAGNIVIYDALDNAVATIDVAAHGGQLSISDNELTINPTANLSESASYYIQVASGAVIDAAGIAYAGIADNTSWNFTVADITPPTVTSITVSGSPAANADSIQFTVTFNEVPANISVGDFTLTPSDAGVSGNIASNSPVNLNTVTVTIDQITGTGTLRLDVNANSGITDTTGNGNGTNGFVPAFTAGELHAVDREAPGIPMALALDAGSDSGTVGDHITNDNTPTITGTADANVIIEVTSDVDGVLGTTTADGSGAWSYTPGTALTDGTHNLTATAADAASNESAASAILTIEIDTTAPTAGIVMADTALIAGETSLLTITFSEAITGFANDDLTLANGTLSPVSSADAGVTWTATFTPSVDTTSATNLVTLANTGVTDVAGNAGVGTTNSNNYAVDTLRPTATIVLADTELTMGETSLVTVTFNRAVTGFDNADLTADNGTLSAVSSSDDITWTATFTPDAGINEPSNFITLDNTGVLDAVGNTGIGNSISSSFIIRTVSMTLLVTSSLDAGDDATHAATLAGDQLDGDGLSLREALYWVRGGDTITFDLDSGTAGNQGGTITLNGNELVVANSNITINGDLNDDGAADITITGNNTSRVMQVNTGVTGVTLEGLMLTEGSTVTGGGGLALASGANVTLRDSVISNNQDAGGGGGGGGGVVVNTAVLTVINSTISGNTSVSFGGGFRIIGEGATLNLLNSTVTGNNTTGAASHGGGIQYAGTGAGRLNIINSTISGNSVTGASALGGGIRVTAGTVNIVNSTIVGNAAGGSGGGGVDASGAETLINTVVAGNTAGAGAIAGASGSPLASGGSASDVSGTLETATNSFFGSNVTITTDTNSLNNQGTSNLLLGDLGNNGGNTLTHRPLTGSALTDAGSTAALPADTFDLDGDNDVTEALPIDAVGSARVAGASVDIGAVEGNRAPELFDLSGGNTYIEDGVAVVIDNDVTVTDDELDELNGGNGNYSGASVTILRNGGVNITDTFGFMDGSGMSLVAGEVIKNGQAIALFDTATAGQLVVTFTDANGELPERSDVNALMQQITYASTSNDPDASVLLDWTFTDEANASVTDAASVTVSLKNDAPTLTATAASPTFIENGTAVDLFSGVTASTVEAAQTLIALELTVTNVNNGSSEILTIDGVDVVLTQGNALATVTNALDVSVALAGTTATVTLSNATGISPAAVQTLVEGMSYRNTSENPNPLTRVVTLTSIQDNGGTANDGVDTTTLALAATVTITAVNNAPTISGTPATVVDQNALYGFTPTAADVDSDTLSFSIVNQPAWASFDTATGALTGVPSQANVGVTTNIVISVSDGTTTTSLPAFSLTVVDVNDAPVISGTPSTSVDQDVAYSFTPTASDPDPADVLTFSITNQPVWASFNTATGALTGTPTRAHVGGHAGIVISVSDGLVTTSLPPFTIDVDYVNAPPVISGTPALVANVGVAYSFTPVASDPDDDELTFSAMGLPAWLSLNTATGVLSGTPTGAAANTSANIILSVSDGTVSASLAAFTLDVEYSDDTPVVEAPAPVTLNATALYTPVSLRQLLGLSPAASQEDIDESLATLASDSTNGNACCTTRPVGLSANNVLLLRPGRHEIVWQATNVAGLTGSAIQVLDLRPLVSFSKQQVAVRGSEISLRVILNGPSPVYPLDIPYAIDEMTTALPDEHSLTDGIASFTEAGQLEVVIPVQLAALSGAGDSQLVLRLDDQSAAGEPVTDSLFDINAGAANRHIISIREGNVAPTVSLQLTQGGQPTGLITPDGGPVTATAVVVDPNTGDSHSYDWAATSSALIDSDGDSVNATWVFDPAGLAGRYFLQVMVTDSAGGTGMTQEYFRVVAQLPVLDPAVDSDGDGIDDLTEGAGDASGNGIPNYLDNMPSSNILPQVIAITDAYLIECDPGVRCRIGPFALVGNSGGVQVLDNEVGDLLEITPDEAFEPVGGVFDFEIKDLPTPGQSVRVVIPQQAAIPANAVYRKYQNGSWVNFMEDANNALHSTAGNLGYCPPPGSADWEPGLVEGYFCVQLTLQDGGPNDADDAINAAVVDPGAVSSALPVIPPVEPPVQPPTQIKSKGGGALHGIWLLLMAGLLLLRQPRRLRARLVVVVTLVAAAFNTQAQTFTDDIYLRADLYRVEGNQTAQGFNNSLAADGHTITLTDYDILRRGYQLALGYRWNEMTYSELGYLDLGSVRVDLLLPAGDDLENFERSFAQHYPRTANGITLVQGVTFPLNSDVSFAAELGAFVWRNEVDVREGIPSPKDTDGIVPLLGVQLNFAISEPLSVGLGIRRVFLDDETVDLWGVSARWGF